MMEKTNDYPDDIDRKIKKTPLNQPPTFLITSLISPMASPPLTSPSTHHCTLLNLNTLINLPHKSPGREKPNASHQHEPQETNQATVPQVQHIARETAQAQFANPIYQGVGNDIEGAAAGGKESPPLPVVVFRAQKEVG